MEEEEEGGKKKRHKAEKVKLRDIDLKKENGNMRMIIKKGLIEKKRCGKENMRVKECEKGKDRGNT